MNDGSALVLRIGAEEDRGPEDSLERADLLLAHATFLGKYRGFMAGAMARMGTIFGPLVGFRFGELRHTLSGQKIDGTQG